MFIIYNYNTLLITRPKYTFWSRTICHYKPQKQMRHNNVFCVGCLSASMLPKYSLTQVQMHNNASVGTQTRLGEELSSNNINSGELEHTTFFFYILVRTQCVRCTLCVRGRTQMATKLGIILFLFSSFHALTFLPEGVCLGIRGVT